MTPAVTLAKGNKSTQKLNTSCHRAHMRALGYARAATVGPQVHRQAAPPSQAGPVRQGLRTHRQPNAASRHAPAGWRSLRLVPALASFMPLTAEPRGWSGRVWQTHVRHGQRTVTTTGVTRDGR